MNFEAVAQQLIYSALDYDIPLKDMVTGVFDFVPDNQRMPYITIGDDTGIDWGSDSTEGADISIDINVWAQDDEDAMGRMGVKTIMGRVREILHDREFFHNHYSVDLCVWERSQVMTDSDGITRHGIITFKLLIESI